MVGNSVEATLAGGNGDHVNLVSPGREAINNRLDLECPAIANMQQPQLSAHVFGSAALMSHFQVFTFPASSGSALAK